MNTKTVVRTRPTIPEQKTPTHDTAATPRRTRPHVGPDRRTALIVTTLVAVLAAAATVIVLAFSGPGADTVAPTQPAQQGVQNPSGRVYEDKYYRPETSQGTSTDHASVADGSDWSKYVRARERGARIQAQQKKLQAQQESVHGSDRHLYNRVPQPVAPQDATIGGDRPFPDRYGLPGRP